jgi:serine/threonine protein kinase
LEDELYRRFPQWKEALKSQLLIHDWLDEPLDEEPEGQSPAPAGASSEQPGPAGQAEARSCEILHEIGQGAMGVVYLGRQKGLNRLVAVKKMRSRPRTAHQEEARFRLEAEAAARLQHPNIVQIYEVGQQGGVPYFVSELVRGGTLEERLAAGPLPARQGAELLEKLAQAVGHAHSHGVVHRDLTPSNVLLTEAGEPKISDFGLAKVLMGGAVGTTHAGELVGTPSYMAPEQAEGRTDRVGPPADIWALGVILYEVLTGQQPFHAPTVLQTLDQVRFTVPAPPRRHQRGVPRQLEAICLKCLHKDPGRRYASAEALADDLRRFLAGQSVQARPPGLVGRWIDWARQWRGLAVLGVLLAVSAGVALLFRW